MRRLVTLASLFIVVLSGCDRHKDSKPAAPVMPKDIPFNEKILPAISDEDYDAAKVAYKEMYSIEGIEKQMLIPKNEDTFDKTEREQAFEKLSPARKQLVQDLRAVCVSEPWEERNDLQQPIAVGSTASLKQQNRLTGPTCSVSMFQSSSTNVTVTSAGPNIAMTFAGDMNAGTKYATVEQQTSAGLSQMFGQGKISGMFELGNQGTSVYVKLVGSGKYEFPNGTPADMAVQVNAEQLVSNSVNKGLSTTYITQSGKVYQLTVFEETPMEKAKVTRYFIGNRELSLAEAAEIGIPGIDKRTLNTEQFYRVLYQQP